MTALLVSLVTVTVLGLTVDQNGPGVYLEVKVS